MIDKEPVAYADVVTGQEVVSLQRWSELGEVNLKRVRSLVRLLAVKPLVLCR